MQADQRTFVFNQGFREDLEKVQDLHADTSVIHKSITTVFREAGWLKQLDVDKTSSN